MLRLETGDPGFAQAFDRIVRDRRESGDDVARDVTAILEDVRARGDETLAELTERSEGWVAGLQLAALAQRRPGDVGELAASLAGQQEWVGEFLASEVLDRQPPAIQRFLLQTAILDEFNAPLCAAVTGDDQAHALLAAVARAKGKDIRDLVVFILERELQLKLIAEVRTAGARVLLRKGGDIGGALMAADPHVSIDVLMGIGGSAEGLMAACAVKALGGAMFARSAPQSEGEREACRTANVAPDRILTHDDLVAGDEVFFSATGISDGWLLNGVNFHAGTIETQSLVLRYETGTRRLISTEHRVK